MEFESCTYQENKCIKLKQRIKNEYFSLHSKCYQVNISYLSIQLVG